MKYGVRYPISGVHECPFGLKQAQLVQFLAIRNGVYRADLVQSRDGVKWEVIG
ncbi:hypothetical protein SEA_SERENITY_66 [Mycobacterium phage Serenity]|uniref:hypothetical protein n=1 Tax=Mycobacterium phage Serenity TaxID=1701853 RepID=UPI0006CE2F1A|nr:hypothetical protein SEA_SERENITY_66 [Mycobacterium phage Serenity]ALF00933.1 hypothetical protein SEA_SERENITY_66 [Mycobacterium phage Serenity]